MSFSWGESRTAAQNAIAIVTAGFCRDEEAVKVSIASLTEQERVLAIAILAGWVCSLVERTYGPASGDFLRDFALSIAGGAP